MGIADTVKGFLTDKVKEKFNIDIVEVDYAKKQNGMNLTIYIDNAEGISLTECEKVHKFVDPLLDELNPTQDKSYTLNISSCGLDWPLKTDEDYARAMGEVIEVSLFAKIDGKKEFLGKLKSCTPEHIELEEDEVVFVIPRKQISKAIKYIEF